MTEEFALTMERSDEEPSEPTVQRPFFDPFTAVARAKLGNPAWEWFSLEALNGGDTLVTGDVPPHPEKPVGKARWRGHKKSDAERVVVTEAEKVAACLAYERESGKCYRCAGTGEVFSSWTVGKGPTYRSCSRCKGAGAVDGVAQTR